jgi:hypothetical protein
MKKYKVIYYRDGLYEILEYNSVKNEYEFVPFQGSLCECESWIRLHEDGYMV